MFHGVSRDSRRFQGHFREFQMVSTRSHGRYGGFQEHFRGSKKVSPSMDFQGVSIVFQKRFKGYRTLQKVTGGARYFSGGFKGI